MKNPVPIKAGYATIGQGAGPMIVTERAGLFLKYGLEVETRLMHGARGVVRGLMNGEIEFGNLAAPALLRTVLAEGADLVFLTGGINQQFLMGRPGIKNRNQLSGARIGFAGDGGLNDVLVRFLLRQLEKEGIHGIQLVTGSESGTERLSALVQGKRDAEIITPPEAIEAKRQGCSFLIDFAEYGLNFALGGIAARRAYIREHEDVTRRFIRAYVEGMHRYRTDRLFTVGVQQEYSGLSDRSVAEETYDLTQPGMPRIPYPVVSALGTALHVMAGELKEAATADALGFVDDRFVREIDDQGLVPSL
ncbi:MAG: ABC transporter substrate-binding protein [Deltaproteobacteria bacterium]|nr:ABC transporter substrate-binding protein [Deltaproteobacteria bacterium]